MSRAQAILATLLVYNVALLAIGWWASRRTRDQADFFLGGRQLGPWVAAISASASSSSAWTLLGVSGAAYAWGLSAVWLFPATVSGFAINWMWVAPRLMAASRGDQSVTLTEFLAGDPAGRWYPAIIRFSSVAILIAFLFYIASQFQGAGNAFAAAFDLRPAVAIAVGAAIIVLYTFAGGFWAVSVTDVVQGLLMVAAALLLPAVALAAVGGPAGLVSGLREVAGADGLSLTRHLPFGAGLAFILGTMGIGLGYPGQPHVVNRFMALRDERAMSQGRIISLVWASFIYAGMLLLGWCARVLYRSAPDGEQIMFHAANELLPPVIAGVVVAAVLSAIMSTADSQLLVATSSVTWDLDKAARREGATQADAHLGRSRAVVLTISVLAVVIAVYAPAAIFSRVLFAWHALGSAFGPALLLRLAGRQVRGGAVLASIVIGFTLTIAFYLLPDTPGDALERLGPFVAALLVGLAGRPR